MPPPPFDFADLLRRARRGCSLATQEVFDRFNHAVLATARRHLHSLLCSKVDPEGLAQDVWAVFFADILPTHEFDCPRQLVRFLWSVARNVTLQVNRRFLERAARDVHREQSLEASVPMQEREARTVQGEQWEQLLKGQLSEVRPVLRQLAEGQSLADVADNHGTTAPHLQRWLLRRIAVTSI